MRLEEESGCEEAGGIGRKNNSPMDVIESVAMVQQDARPFMKESSPPSQGIVVV